MKKLRLLVLHKDGKTRWHTLPWGHKSISLAREWGEIVFSEVYYE